MTKYKILEILRAKKDFISGEDIKKKLNISRTAVWKSIKSLREKGYNIVGINNKGYKFIEDNSDIISEYEIKNKISKKEIGKNIHYFKTITSTNKYSLENFEDFSHGDIIIADEQTEGRAKSKKYFYSPKELGIYMSIILKENIFYDSIKLLSISIFLSICHGIEKITDIVPELTWNGVYLNGKKIGGVLTQSIFESETEFIECSVIGIGINVNNSIFPNKLKLKTTSLKIECQKQINRKELIIEILNEFERYILNKKYILNRKEILDEYLKRLNLKNKNILMKFSNKRIYGKVIGLNERGGLILLKENKKKEIFYNGEILNISDMN